MMQFLRSQSQFVLVVILVVIGGSFLFYGNVGSLLTGGGGRGSNDYGRIDGQDLSVAELYDAIRTTHDGLILGGHAQQLSQPGAGAQVAEEAWRQLLLLHEADRLGIEISDQELVDYIHSQSIFQKDGVYSPDLYQTTMTNLQNRFHISPDAFVNVVRDGLRSDAVSKALFSTVRTSAQDVSKQYEKYYGPTQVSVVTLDPKTFVAQTKVTPSEIQAEYQAHPENPDYRTPEKRKVDYVLLSLTPEQAKLPTKQKATAIEALGEKALDLALAFQPDPSASANGTPAPAIPDFQTEARKKGMTPVTTDFFAADTSPAGLPPSPAFNNAAFAVSKDNPVKVAELENGVAVVHLNATQPSELRPLDQVSAGIAKHLQEVRAEQSAQATAQIEAGVLRSMVAKGTDFKVAAASLKLPVQTLPSFLPAESTQSGDRQQTIAYVSSSLGVGGVSAATPIQSDNTAVIVHLDSRAPANPAGLAAFEARFRQTQDQQMRNVVYIDWANWEGKQPGTHPPPDLEQYGGVE